MPQRLLVEVIRGPLKGQSFSVHESGVLLVGRLPECAISIPQDLTVSRQQFRIEFQAPNFRLVHLSQTGETLVNDVSVSSVELRSGDKLQFGADNSLRIAIEEVSQELLSAPTQSKSPQAGLSLTFTKTSLDCGWTCFQGQQAEFDSGRMIELLNRSGPILAVIDFRHMNRPASSDLIEPVYLFPWLDSDAARQFSPIVASITGDGACGTLIQQCWGSDGIVCFGSKVPREDAISHWRKSVGVVGDGPGPSMTAYFWPSLLNTMLHCQPKKQLEPFLSNLGWILVESNESPCQWNLYSTPSFEKELIANGFTPHENVS